MKHQKTAIKLGGLGVLAGVGLFCGVATAHADASISGAGTVIEVPGTDVEGVGAPVPNGDEVVVHYSQQFWPLTGLDSESLGDSVNGGVDALHTVIASTSGFKHVVSNSQGGLVAHQVQNDLVNDPTAPPADQMDFVYYGDPLQPHNGFFTVLPVPVPGPGAWYWPKAAEPSQYPTTYVSKQYDMAADFPDRWWNLVADVNALVGFFYGSRHWYGDVNLSDSNNIVTTEGNVTYVFVPSPDLPLTQPLRDMGLDTSLADSVLRPIVDAGYSRNDGPHADTPPPIVNKHSVVTNTSPVSTLDSKLNVKRSLQSIGATP